jgi:hypothetical protein
MINLAFADKTCFKGFIKEELYYHNHLVSGLSSKVRTNPTVLLSLHKDWTRLWETLAEYGTSITPFLNASEDISLPEHLEPHRRMLLGRNVLGQRFLNESILYTLNLAAKETRIDPQIRKSMARVFLDFYRIQASKFMKKDKLSKPINLLGECDLNHRSCLQMPRMALSRIEYLSDLDQTHIYTPYSKTPVKVDGYDLASDRRWNMAILHYQSNEEKESWFVDIKHSQVPYYLEYTNAPMIKTSIMMNTNRRCFE